MIRTSINVKYKFARGWHVFESDDVLGLYVAHRDAKKCFDDVQKIAANLLKVNEGSDYRVVSELSFDQFIKNLLINSYGSPRYTTLRLLSL